MFEIRKQPIRNIDGRTRYRSQAAAEQYAWFGPQKSFDQESGCG
jgi:hypothetical protein